MNVPVGFNKNGGKIKAVIQERMKLIGPGEACYECTNNL